MPVLFQVPAGYVDDAADALGESSVHVSSEVPDGAALAGRLEAQIADASIGVAVFSDNAALEASGPDIVAELAGRTGYDTIIVAVGSDLSAGSRVLEQGEAMRIANEAEATAGSLEDALTETVQTVIVESEPTAPVGGGGEVGVIVTITVIVAVLVGGVTTLLVRRRARTAAPGSAPALPDRIARDLRALRALAGEYTAAGAAGSPVAARTAQDIDVIAGNTEELFRRLGRKGDDAQRRLAEIEYADKLAKLSAALDRDYLLDILTHPHLWDDPQERVREVQDAAEAVSAELVENIKQINARRALHFQVSLDGLVGGRKELRDWDREFGRATGEHGERDRGQ